jgi:hypothetical protein
MPIILEKKIVKSNEQTDLVWQAYQSSLSEFTVTADPLAPDEKTVRENLETEEKKPIEGWYHGIIRYVGLSNEAYYELERFTANVGEMADVFYYSLHSSLLVVLAKSVYDDDSIEYTGKATKMMSAEKIDNHYMLICEIILRITMIALDEDLIKKRKTVQPEEDDKVVMVLKKFVRQLKANTDITGKLFGKFKEGRQQVTAMVDYLDKLFDSKATEINTLIFSSQDSEAPKKSFKMVKHSLEQVQIKLRGYLLVYLDLISRELLNKPLVTSDENIGYNMVLAFYPLVINSLLKHVIPNVLEDEDEVFKETSTILFIPENIKIITMLTKIVNVINDPEKKKLKKHTINEIKKLLILDEQLNAIKDAVSQFIAFANLGGWIPIFLQVIRPEVLSKMIAKFQATCKEITNICFAYLNKNSSFSVGLAALPPFEWARLQTINTSIAKLTSKEMMERVYKSFNIQIEGLAKSEELLFRHNLLSEHQHLIDTKLTPPQRNRMISTQTPLLPPSLPLTHSATTRLPIGEEFVGHDPFRSSSYNQSFPGVGHQAPYNRPHAQLYDPSHSVNAGVHERGPDRLVDRRIAPRGSPSVSATGRASDIPYLPMPGADLSDGRGDALRIQVQPIATSGSYSHRSSGGSVGTVGGSGSAGSGSAGRTTSDSRRTVEMMEQQYPYQQGTSRSALGYLSPTTKLAPSSVLFPQNQPNLDNKSDTVQESPTPSPKQHKPCCTIL